MKRMAILPVLLSVSMTISAQDIAEVKDLLYNERYASAEQLLEQKVADPAHDAELNYLLIKTYFEQDKKEEATQFVESHHEAIPGTEPMNHIAYGRYLLGIGNTTEADTFFDQLLEDRKTKKNPLLLMTIAEAYIDAEKGDAKKALAVLDMASNKDKKNAEMDVLRGKAYRKLGDGSNAYLAYKDALEKDPSNLQAHYLMGKIFVTQKNTSIYMEHFNKAYEIDSTYVPVLDELYDHYYYRDTKEARKYLSAYIANADKSIENDYRWTDMLYLAGDYNAAIASAKELLKNEKEDAQPRLYKLIAYAYEASGDSLSAKNSIEKYFAKEEPSKWIAADYDFRARMAQKTGDEINAMNYYIKAAELDSLPANKIKYAGQIADLAKGLKDYHTQAIWLGNFNRWNENSTNVDLFYWGIAHYYAREYAESDSVFAQYVAKYPEHIAGYYWRATNNAAIDTAMALGTAVPFYEKVVEMAEKENKDENKPRLVKAYSYLGGYEANIKKNYPAALAWFEKFHAIDPGNADGAKYVELLKKWIADGK